MKPNLVKVRKKRQFSEEFKRSIVNDFESGSFSVLQLSKLHGVDFVSIYNWIYKFSSYNERSSRIVEMKESSSQKLKELESKIKELERVVGQKQLQIDYMEKMLEIAQEDLGIDIKKNYSTPRSTGSVKTRKK
jgi:transposase-like protein